MPTQIVAAAFVGQGQSTAELIHRLTRLEEMAQELRKELEEMKK